MGIVMLYTGLLAQLATLLAGDLAAAVVHLFANDYIPQPGDTVAAFDAPTYTGYATKVIGTWGSHFIDGNGNATSVAPPLTWLGPADDTGENIFGYYVVSAGMGTPLLCAERFISPMRMFSAEDAIPLLPIWQVSTILNGGSFPVVG